MAGYDPWATAGDGEWFDEAAADYVVEFVESFCTHVKGSMARRPFLLEPWQREFVRTLFGWKRRDGTRRYREAFLFVPRKNGKTAMAAALLCYMLFCEDEPGSEIYSAAADRKQAQLVQAQVNGMIRNCPAMRDRSTIYKYAVEVDDRSYQPLSAEAGTKHGLNTHFVIVDELHAQRDRELVDVLMTSTGARTNPLVLHITTSDYDREGSICNEKHDYASKVRDGIVEDSSFLPVIYEASRDDDWTDPKVWAKANPNLGVSVSEDYLLRECRRAKEVPAFENTFKRLHLNIRTEQAFRWMPMDLWDGCNGAVDEAALIGRPCTAGLDLASIEDMAALVLTFRVEDEYHVLPYFWCPQDTAEKRERKQRQPYLTWARQGLLELTPGNTIDYRHVRKRINELSQQYQIREIAFDPWNATTIAQQLCDEDGFEMVQFRQGTVSMNEPMKEVMRLVRQKKIRHGGHPILRWNASNIAARADASDNVRPDKEKSAEKIDGLVALIMSIGRTMAGTDSQPELILI